MILNDFFVWMTVFELNVFWRIKKKLYINVENFSKLLSRFFNFIIFEKKNPEVVNFSDRWTT